MKRIKTSDILIIIAISLTFLFGIFVFLVLHHYANKENPETDTTQSQYTDFQQVKAFSVIVLSDNVDVKILQGQNHTLKYSGTLAYIISGDTLYPQSDMLIITPAVKTIIARNHAKFKLQLAQDTISFILSDNAVGKVENSHFTHTDITGSNHSFIKFTPGTYLGNTVIHLNDNALASLLGKIDTLSGQTSNKTFIYTSDCKEITARIKGTHTNIDTSKVGLSVQINSEKN